MRGSHSFINISINPIIFRARYFLFRCGMLMDFHPCHSGLLCINSRLVHKINNSLTDACQIETKIFQFVGLLVGGYCFSDVNISPKRIQIECLIASNCIGV